jgi:hypothetical protein
VARVAAEHPGAAAVARRRHPGLLVWAAARASAETVALLAGLGFDVNAYGRGDAPAEGAWETALHHAAGNGDTALARRLLDLGADPDRRDKRFGATALGWARHFDQRSTAELLEPLTAPD